MASSMLSEDVDIDANEEQLGEDELLEELFSIVCVIDTPSRNVA
jgi:hypothetical protein